MGFRFQNEHFVYIEEALYLVENGYAKAMKQNQEETLSLAHLYSLLEKFGIFQLKYVIFSKFISAGYILKRPLK